MSLRSLAPRLVPFALLLLGGCWVDDEPRERVVVVTPTPAPEQPSAKPAQVTIQTGQSLTSDPGKGAGVFIEYRGGGEWSLHTTCDTAIGGGNCSYDLYLTPESGSSVSRAEEDGDGKSTNDAVSIVGGRAEAHLRTTLESDGVKIQVDPPGAGLLVEAWLDGSADPRLLYWIGPDVLHQGAPTNPLLLVPSSP